MPKNSPIESTTDVVDQPVVESATPTVKMVKAVNRSATTLTIPSQDHKLWPPRAIEEITEEEAERWKDQISII